MVTNAVSEENLQAEAEKLFVGKTIVGVDTEAINAWQFTFADGNKALIENVDFHIHPGVHRLVCREVRE